MKVGLLASLALLALLSSACSNEAEPIVIRLFRDPSATEIERALRAVDTKQLRSARGQPVIIATIEPRSYAEGLEHLGYHYHPELIIFNSPEDGKKVKVEIPVKSVVQIGAKQFYLVIPPWVPEERRQTAELVLTELRRELQRTSQPVTGPLH
jgi:hypothetical protein